MLLQLLHCFGNSPLQLRVVTLADQFRILPDFNIRRDSVVFDFPLTFQSWNGKRGAVTSPPSINCG